MTPRTLATIILRLIGAWFFIEALCGLGALWFFHQDLMAGMAGVHRRWYDGGSQIGMTGADFYLHDTYYVVSHFYPGLVGAGLRLIAGLVLLFASKPIARLLSRNLDAF